ncbi:FAD:protein FMN transferase [Uliginosibacterium sp. TH139]|uniref:FAD:protein FMN transferase n=1 Tax=Uliginosibacterium sp. TH139 TaxID=2067453 RepID=UPI000C7A8C5D|nr:FAD:protein FMN transferase [Uliginosibacterium sp. TH139]PLK48980.1 thiamine biosynthesis protein ApbE [Uliginosibacterium sp. TH139]
MNAPAFRALIPARIDQPAGLPEGDVYKLAGNCMGTTWSVRVVVRDCLSPRQLQADIAALLEGLEAQMSHFRASSPLRRFATLPPGCWMDLPAAFAQVMRTALKVAHLSEGAFDPALGSVIDAWGFGAAQRFSEAGFAPPAAPLLPGRRWQALELDDAGRLRQPGGIALNLAAIAKGFAVDAVAAFLTGRGLDHHLVEVGGELRGSGIKPDGQPWWVALESPAQDCPLPATRVALHGLAVATSGNYRRCYLLDERLIQHTLDPRSGEPVTHGLASVTVIHEECMQADAWATALMVLGPQAGLQRAAAQGLRALLQWRDERGEWHEAASPAFEALLV